MFTCVVCHKKFKDTWQHIDEKTFGLLRFKDKIHADYFDKLEKCEREFAIGQDNEGHNYEGITGYTLPCFCGGHITIHGHGEDSWDSTCDSCGFLYDED